MNPKSVIRFQPIVICQRNLYFYLITHSIILFSSDRIETKLADDCGWVVLAIHY